MTRRQELSRQAARLFAQKGYHGTSIGDLAEALGVQKGSLYAHIEGKEDLLYETMRDGARAFHAGLDAIPEQLKATEKIRLALRAHLQIVAGVDEDAVVLLRRLGGELGSVRGPLREKRLYLPRRGKLTLDGEGEVWRDPARVRIDDERGAQAGEE
jgi:AcrR family transcriptional regulator